MAKVKLSPTSIVREAKRIKTTPSVLAVRSLKFKGKPDCEKLVRFIKSSGEELSKISIPSKRDAKKLLGGGIGGGVAGLDPLGTTLAATMYPKEVATGVGVGGLLGLGGIGLVDLLTGRRMSKGIMKGVKGVGSKISNAGKGIKNFFGKGGGVVDDLAEATVKKTSKKVATKVAQKGAKSTVSKGLGALPLIGNLWDLGSAAYRFKQGDTVGGLLSLGSAIPVAGWGFAALDIARDTGAFEGTALQNKKEEGKEEKQEDKEVKKSTKETKGSDASKVIDKFDSTVNKFSLKGKTLNVVSQVKKISGFNRGGEVTPQSGQRVKGAEPDTQLIAAQPGEVVMSKPAVDKIGADKLLAANAAGGGTNKPKYTMGQNSRKEFTRKYNQKTRNTEKESPEIKGSIGVPDLMKHQQQLVEELRNVQGYEIAPTINITGGGLVQEFQGGGLVQGFNGGGLVAQAAPTPIKLTKQNSSVGMVENETIIINRIPVPQPQSQQGGGQIIPVPIGGSSKGQVSPLMPSTYEIVNSIRISSLLTKLSIT